MYLRAIYINSGLRVWLFVVCLEYVCFFASRALDIKYCKIYWKKEKRVAEDEMIRQHN